MPDDHPLTEEQQKAIRDILRQYREEANAIIAEHQARVKLILDNLDKKKSEELEKLIKN